MLYCHLLYSATYICVIMFVKLYIQSTVKRKTEDLESSVKKRDELKTQLESTTVS